MASSKSTTRERQETGTRQAVKDLESKSSADQPVVIMLRIQPEVASQIDALIPKVSKVQARSERGVGRTGVVRYALARFLDQHQEDKDDGEK